MIPRFDPKAKGWRGAGGRFMKLGVPIDGWVLVRCEGCGQLFPTRAWHPCDQERPDYFFCTEKCRVSGKVAELLPEAERDADVIRRYQEGEPLAAIQEAHRISTGTIFRILHGTGSSPTGAGGEWRTVA